MSKVKIIGPELPNIPWEEPQDPTDTIWRYSANPVINRRPKKDVCRVFNSAIIPYQGEFISLVRAEEYNTCSHIRVARSHDGLHFDIEDKPFDLHDEQGNLLKPQNYGYDPRLCEIDGEYYGVWCTECYPDATNYPTLCLAKTKDFKYFTRLSNPVIPPQRNGVLFPRKVNGEYILLSRPSDLGHTPFGDIFASFSKDMVYWGKHKGVLQRNNKPYAGWASLKIGAGPVPIETSEGWLLIYHGVVLTCNGYVYSMGACMLDINDPTKVLYDCKPALLTPEADYETKGFVDNVVFPCAALADSKTGRIAVYYGAADTTVCVAFTTIDKIVDYMKANKH